MMILRQEHGLHPFAGLKPPELESLNHLQAEFRADARSHKVDLMVGSYCSDSGEQSVLRSVDLAKGIISSNPAWHHGYPSSHLGEPEFRDESCKLLFGLDSDVYRSSSIASMQALGGSGACHMGALFLQKYYYPGTHPKVYVPDHSWANHINVFESVGLRTSILPYFHSESKALALDRLIQSLIEMPEKSIVVLQACGNNPSGCDLTRLMWDTIAPILRRRSLFVFLDVAYQGFVSGNVQQDVIGIQILLSHNVSLLVAATYSKAFGLYGERVGHVCIPTPDSKTRLIVEGHMKLLARAETGAQPGFGALIVSTILNDQMLRDLWQSEVRDMASSLRQRRTDLHILLQEKQPGRWDHLLGQVGMFFLTGLDAAQITRLRVEHAVYLQDTGRISVAGLNRANIPLVAKALLAVS